MKAVHVVKDGGWKSTCSLVSGGGGGGVCVRHAKDNSDTVVITIWTFR